tara:strand:- start:2309 stop:3118 length:810 start_codon:yes stop_codon:yes gene_type:complete
LKKKILIFGKNSFIGSNLYTFLKNKHFVKIRSFNSNSLLNLNKFDYIINCSTNKKYINNIYSKSNDFDLKIVKNLDESTNFIFLSSRKIYKPKANIYEVSKIKCLDNYEKNKYITEKKIVKIKGDKCIILRISNIIGFKKYNPRKIHSTYLDFFVDKINKGELISNRNEFKDFLDINTFSKIINLIIKKKVFGIYNISIGKKVYLKVLNNWLLDSIKSKEKFKIIKLKDKQKKQSFYLNNSKIKKKININISIAQLKKECIKLSKILWT